MLFTPAADSDIITLPADAGPAVPETSAPAIPELARRI